MNLAFLDLVGYAEEEVVGSTPPYPWWASNQELAHGPREETVYRHRDGSLIPISMVRFVVPDASGAGVAMSASSPIFPSSGGTSSSSCRAESWPRSASSLLGGPRDQQPALCDPGPGRVPVEGRRGGHERPRAAGRSSSAPGSRSRRSSEPCSTSLASRLTSESRYRSRTRPARPSSSSGARAQRRRATFARTTRAKTPSSTAAETSSSRYFSTSWRMPPTRLAAPVVRSTSP